MSGIEIGETGKSQGPVGRVIVVGADGRMGRRLVALAGAEGLEVVHQVDREGQALTGALAGDADVLIDFSVRSQVHGSAAFCREYGLPLVMGTTGIEEAERVALDAAAEYVPVLWAPNFSTGVNVLFELVAEAAKMLGGAFDVELVEAHHRRKVDAPSGTAKELARRVAAARGWDLDAVARFGRSGLVGPRGDDEFGISVIRGGSVVGEHTMYYLGEGEEIAISHKATDRDIFVRGALRAARWLLEQTPGPGSYSMGDVVRSGL